MRRTIQGLMVAGVLTASLVFAGPALAAKKTVCASGCAFSSIQSAINAATPGATITIAMGSYTENVVVTKSVTLQGSGMGTVIMPAVSDPVCSPGSLCGGAASNIVLVQADNVTLEHLTLEGDNPSLTSGVVRGGKDIDARNGIITNHEAGTFNNLTVSKVKVADVYLRGIYASSGGTFNFNHDAVENVEGEEASIAIFDFEGAGVISNNTVTAANDAISANWSKGTQFLDNKVSNSGSGIHTDNNGGSGGTADLIQGNKISGCPVNGYGIFVFAPYVSATVNSNKVTGCSVGLAAFGSQVSGQGPTFSGNRVDGTGATSTEPGGTYGAYLTTDLLGFAFGDLNATLTGNTIQHFGTGMFVTQSNPSPEQPAGGQATVSASNNSIQNDTAGAKGEPGTVVNAQNNWWGCKNGPNMGGKCESATGTVAFTPSLTARP
jgi:nitrous oxidase accessory protein NosD